MLLLGQGAKVKSFVEDSRVHLGNGKKLEIEVERTDPSHQYIQAFALHGKEQRRAWFHHSEIAHGGKLSLVMGPEPNLNFGAGAEVAPPSLTL